MTAIDALNAPLVIDSDAPKAAGGDGAAQCSDAIDRRTAAARVPAARAGPARRAGPATKQTNLVPSVPHQYRQIGVREHVARHTTQDQFAQRAMRIRAHDEKVSSETVSRIQQRLPERARVNRQHMQAGY